MPLYNYDCNSCDWSADKIFSASKRPNVIDCPDCGKDAIYKITLSKYQNSDAKFITKKYSKEKRGLSMHQFRCVECSHVFEEIIDHSKGESADDNQDCPECSASGCKWQPSARIDRWSEQFPYYDRGLGVMLKNKAHRREICKQRGLTPVEGDYDEEKIFSKFDNRRESEEKEYNDYVDRLDNSPEFAAYRKAKEQGRF
mgnify:FL=1